MMDDDNDFGDLGTRRSDYLADLDWAGCRNCGHPINITIPVRRFALDILYHLGDAAEVSGSQALRETLSTLSADCWSAVLSQHYDDHTINHIIEATERAKEEERAATAKVQRSRKRKR